MVKLTGNIGKVRSTLKEEINYFLRSFTICAIIQAVIVFIAGVSNGYSPLEVFINGFIIIMIGNVPQG